MLLSIFALAAAAGPASDRQREVERAVFELCPQAIAGTWSLTDPAQLEAAGYRATAPRETDSGPMPRAVRGTGAGQIFISASSDGGHATCAVWFGGPDNRALFRGVRRRVRASGYAGGNRLMLGDRTPMYAYRRAGPPPSTLVIFEADAGGGLDFAPVTTVVTMSGGE